MLINNFDTHSYFIMGEDVNHEKINFYITRLTPYVRKTGITLLNLISDCDEYRITFDDGVKRYMTFEEFPNTDLQELQPFLKSLVAIDEVDINFKQK